MKALVFGIIQNYLQNEAYPRDAMTDQRTLRQLASGYFLTGGVLYKRSWNGLHLRCVDEGEAQTIMDSLYNGESGPHMHGVALARKIMNLGYYWTTMNADCVRHTQKCHECQIFAKLQRQPPVNLNHSLPVKFESFTMAFRNLGHRCDRKDPPEGFQWSSIHPGCCGLFH
ncbi:uncharacterized protein LOC119370603 [Jatropha curcas]|uniref:uncharacterized protein LOC119370603 n=1 Tax=Jatropha curcas TaxID=180498 RepID=UPI0018960912|nr:uncharacterized protein LOC119370603 [Jatropha curcas]